MKFCIIQGKEKRCHSKIAKESFMARAESPERPKLASLLLLLFLKLSTKLSFWIILKQEIGREVESFWHEVEPPVDVSGLSWCRSSAEVLYVSKGSKSSVCSTSAGSVAGRFVSRLLLLSRNQFRLWGEKKEKRKAQAHLNSPNGFPKHISPVFFFLHSLLMWKIH